MNSEIDSFFNRCKELIEQRQIDYATPQVNLTRIAKAWTEYMGFAIGPYDVCMMMVMLKMSRLCNGYHQDSIEDAASYLALASMMSETRIED